jgi:hypothetical protein
MGDCMSRANRISRRGHSKNSRAFCPEDRSSSFTSKGVVADRPECRQQGRRCKGGIAERRLRRCSVCGHQSEGGLGRQPWLQRLATVRHVRCSTSSGFVAFNGYSFLPKLGRNCAAPFLDILSGNSPIRYPACSPSGALLPAL